MRLAALMPRRSQIRDPFAITDEYPMAQALVIIEAVPDIRYRSNGRFQRPRLRKVPVELRHWPRASCAVPRATPRDMHRVPRQTSRSSRNL